MIFDSHVHYSIKSFDNQFRALRLDGNEYIDTLLTRDELIKKMKSEGIIGCLEPSIKLENISAQVELAKKYPGYIYLAFGSHPTRCFLTKWKKRKLLEGYVKEYGAIAIGETGLDYHQKRKNQHRIMQKLWFKYQIKVADKLNLPLILHIREANDEALRILKKHKNMLHGGVVHCFAHDYNVAKEYIELGFTIGIGGALLNSDDRAKRVCDTVEKISLSKILIETDAPYVFPEIPESNLKNISSKKTKNTSLILPMIIKKISEIKNILVEDVEKVTTENVCKTFGIK